MAATPLLVKYFLTALALEALNRASNDSEPTPVTWEAIRTCLICFTRFSPRATSSRTRFDSGVNRFVSPSNAMGFDTEMPLVDTEANRPPARRGALGDDPLRARATGVTFPREGFSLLAC